MIESMSNIQQKLTIILIIFSTTFVSYILHFNDINPLLIWPGLGFSIGFFSMFRNKHLFPILLGSFLGHLVGVGLSLDLSVINTILLSVTSVVTTYIAMFLFTSIMDKTSSFGRIDRSSAILFYLALLSIGLLVSLIKTMSFGLFIAYPILFDEFLNWLLSITTGLVVFGNLVLLSFYFDSTSNIRKVLLSFGYMAFFASISVIIFSDGFSMINGNQSFVFVALIFLPALFFSYRSILTIIFLYILLYKFHYVDGFNSNLMFMVFDFNIFVIMTSYIAIITRMTYYNLILQNEDLQVSNNKLEMLINSTNQLLNIRDFELTNKETNIQYLKNIFSIANNLFDNFDAASCYIKIDDKPMFIDATYYDEKMLNELDFSRDFVWALQEPEHITNAEVHLRQRLKVDYQTYSEVVPEIKESIRFGIYIDEVFSGGISFDIFQKSEKRFSQEDLNGLRAFQRLMNSFYEINYLNNKHQFIKNDLVVSLIKTLELYDQYTGGHSEEVAMFSRAIAQEMNLKDDDVYSIYWAGVVHDIGKVGISNEVINKSEKLTLEEYEVVKKHSVFGSDILEASDELKDIALLVKHHHEWWNGNGYPSGLSGNDIPLGSQILCVSDAVSAMVGERPYSGQKEKSEIIKELEMYSGVHFSPEPAKVMIQLIKDGLIDEFYVKKEKESK